MPLPFAVPFGLLLGLVLAWASRGELARSEVALVLGRPFLAASGFALLVFAPVIGYFAALHGDWAYLYLIRWSRVPSALDLALVLLAAVQVPVGFAVAARWAIGRQGTMLLKFGAVVAFLLVVLAGVCARRLSVSATFTQYHGGFGGVPIGQSPLGRGLLLSWTALAVGLGWTLVALRARTPSR